MLFAISDGNADRTKQKRKALCLNGDLPNSVTFEHNLNDIHEILTTKQLERELSYQFDQLFIKKAWISILDVKRGAGLRDQCLYNQMSAVRAGPAPSLLQPPTKIRTFLRADRRDEDMRSTITKSN